MAVCPITGRPFFGSIEHPELGTVATYGGPFDSYTIPTPDDDGELHSERYDHDRGEWIEGGEPMSRFSEAQPSDIAPAHAALREAVEYLDNNSLNSIGAGSILHRQIREALVGTQTDQKPETDLIEIARATGLREMMHGIRADKVLQEFIAALPHLPVDDQERRDAVDANRYRYARDNISEDHELPGGWYLDDEGETWDKTIDAAMAASAAEGKPDA